MKKKYLKLLMLPILCTALSACDNAAVSTNTSSEGDLVSNSTEEVTTIEDDSVPNSTEVTTSIVEEKTETQKIVTNVLDAYRDEDIVGKMFEGSNAIDASLDMNLNATLEDTKAEHSKIDIDMGIDSAINVNTYVDDTNEEVPVKIYSEASAAGDINYAADVGVEDEESGEITSYVPSHLITDMDLDTQFEVSDKTYVKAQGLFPAFDMIADSEEYVESPEDVAERTNPDFKGYLPAGYLGWKNTINTLISLAESAEEADPSDEEPIDDQEDAGIFGLDFDLNDEETYNNIYELLSSEEDNNFLTRAITENAEGYTFGIALNIDAIDILSFLPGETIGAQLSTALGLEGEDAIDYATIVRNSPNSNKVDLEVKLGKDFLIENLSLDLNLDGIDIEVREYEEVDENTTTEAPVISENYMVNIEEFNILLNTDFTYGEDVSELEFSEEDKADILENGTNLTETIAGLIGTNQ